MIGFGICAYGTRFSFCVNAAAPRGRFVWIGASDVRPPPGASCECAAWQSSFRFLPYCRSGTVVFRGGFCVFLYRYAAFAVPEGQIPKARSTRFFVSEHLLCFFSILSLPLFPMSFLPGGLPGVSPSLARSSVVACFPGGHIPSDGYSVFKIQVSRLKRAKTQICQGAI